MPTTNFSDAVNKGITPSQRRSRALALAYLDLKKGKTSQHSKMGSTLCYFIRQLELDRIPYTLRAVPGFGYALTTNPDIDKVEEEASHDSTEQSREEAA